MTPIEKNIIVVDELGNEYEATYPKRAKGLVKNGRARFIDDNKICLACPPHIELEDTIMSENKNVNANVPKEVTKAKNQVVENKSVEQLIAEAKEQHLIEERFAQRFMDAVTVQNPMTMEYVLGKIEEIANNQSIFSAAIEEIGKIRSGGPGDVGTQEQTKAIADVIKARETTNQRLIAFYEKMYDDLKPKNDVPSERMQVINSLINTLGDGMTPIESKEALENILGVALQDLTRNI